MTEQEALHVLATIGEAHLCNGADRRTINDAVATLAKHFEPTTVAELKQIMDSDVG